MIPNFEEDDDYYNDDYEEENAEGNLSNKINYCCAFDFILHLVKVK
jgi:hypothetical protein